MAKFYEMPAVSPTMEFGTLVAWRLAEGQAFPAASVVAEVGTDKANMEAEIFDKGVMLKHLVAVGDEIPPGFPIAIVGDAVGEDVAELLKAFDARKQARVHSAGGGKAAPAEAPARPSAPAASPVAAPAPAPVPAAVGRIERSWNGKQLNASVHDTLLDVRYGPVRRVVASPLAKVVAAERGVDLAKVRGTGPGGRVLRADVESAGAVATSVPVGRTDVDIKLTPMRKTIARRLLASHQDIPTFFLTATLDMNGVVALREELKRRLPDVKVSYNDLFIACVARALRESPAVNAAWTDSGIVRYGRVDIGVAVAIEDGLITPVVRGADTLGVGEIARQIRDLAGRAKEQKLKPDEYTGSTFTISNLGMYDIEQFTAIINPPEAAILAVGAIAQVPVVTGGALGVGWRMKVTMTCDHRVIDGATGAQFLQVLRRYVESPALMLL